MRMFDIITKKKLGQELSKDEIAFFINGYLNDTIPDYQASALLMAICLKGMSDEETLALTQAMAFSGIVVDLSEIDGITVDKHSTGGVGDKTTLIVAPIVSALGCKIAKMSGRGLGHTGGTIDKLESIPGFNTTVSTEDFIKQVKDIGIAVIGQSLNLAPADKKLYALRDVTATIDSIPLIASSIMSKKIAAGSSCIVLDVKTGSGAFMKTFDDSKALAQKMVDIGNNAGRKTAALITNMDTPLGNAIGNSLEIIEALEILNGEKDGDLKDICIELSATILHLASDKDLAICRDLALETIDNGSALKKFRDMVLAQGGNIEYIDDISKFKKSLVKYDLVSKATGYISCMNAEEIGNASAILGAGRIKKDDTIDYSAGIILHKKTGDFVDKGDTIASFFTSDEHKLNNARIVFEKAISYSDTKPKNEPLIYDIVL